MSQRDGDDHAGAGGELAPGKRTLTEEVVAPRAQELAPGKRTLTETVAARGFAHPGEQFPGAREVQRQMLQLKAELGAAASTAVIVDDAVLATPLQARRHTFLASLDPAIKATVAQVLGPGWATDDCPYIAKYLTAYAGRPASEVESFIRRYTGSKAQDAKQLAHDLLARVRAGVEHWKQTGTLPADAMAADPTLAKTPEPAGAVQKKADGIGSDAGASPEQVLEALGEGAPLDGGVAARMGGAFGTSFDDVRVHTDPGGEAMAQQHGAQAFTVGKHIAFAPGRYRSRRPRKRSRRLQRISRRTQRKPGSRRSSG